MADLQIIILFCTLYSGIVISALWIAVADKQTEQLKTAFFEDRG